jgi:hypothetical protein
MPYFDDETMRDAIDTVTRLTRDCCLEPDNYEHQQALVVAVRHYNVLGYGFKLTREGITCRRINGAQSLHR